MQFTKLPTQYSPVAEGQIYRLDAGSVSTFDVQLLDCFNNLLAAKRFAGVRTAEFDVYPYLYRLLKFEPAVEPTGFYFIADRMVQLRIWAGGTMCNERIFFPGTTIHEEPEVKTTMPLSRIIARGEPDELTIFSSSACMPELAIYNEDGSRRTEWYDFDEQGMVIFKIDTSQYPDAERLVLKTDDWAVEYTVVPKIAGSRRLAWRSSAGSIEHYTFPAVKSEALEADKTRAYGSEGVVTTAVKSRRRTTLCSAFERQEVIDALAEIVCSPEVWELSDGVYMPVDVTTTSAVIRRNGAMSTLEVEIAGRKTEGI